MQDLISHAFEFQNIFYYDVFINYCLKKTVCTVCVEENNSFTHLTYFVCF